jgi:hypothetical protein
MDGPGRRILIAAIGVAGLVPISMKTGIVGAFSWLICIGLVMILVNKGE